MAFPDFTKLYQKYDEELYDLASCLQTQYHLMQRRGYVAAFGDVEGELLYMLIREAQPEVVFEISSATGWSTNYILAALTCNQKGVVHAFELNTVTQGQPTEQVIRNNQYHLWDQQRLVVHIGDAQQIAPTVAAGQAINFLLLDSCHEDWFARWYIDTLLDRVDGLVIIQDIAFEDRLEASSEAEYVWAWLNREQINVTLFGAIEVDLEHTGIRSAYSERRSLRSNAILFQLPQTGTGKLPQLMVSPESLIGYAEQAMKKAGYRVADRAVNEAIYHLLRMSHRANRHRLFIQAGDVYLQMGKIEQTQRCFQRAIGIVLQGDQADRVKGLPELFAAFGRRRQWKLLAQIGILLMFEPQSWSRVFQKTRAFVGRGLRN